MYILKLIYQNGDEFIVGGFNSIEDAEVWVDSEKLKPYWQITTAFEIAENI